MSTLYVSTNLLTGSVDSWAGIEVVFLFGEEFWIENAHDGMVFMFFYILETHVKFV